MTIKARIKALATLVTAAFLAALSGPIADGESFRLSYELPALRLGPTTLSAVEWEVGAVDLPESLPIYYVDSADISAATALSSAESLGLSAPIMELDLSKDAYYVHDLSSPFVVQIHRPSGSLLYMDPDRIFDTVDAQPVLPEPEEARKMAISFLRATGLLPSQDVLTENPAYYWNDQNMVNSETGEKTTYQTNLQVRFERTVEGYPSVGAGAKLYVHFADGKEIVGVTKMWPAVAPVGVTERILSMDALRATVTSLNLDFDAPPPCATAIVENVELSYYVPSPFGESRTVFPVFDVSGPCLDAEGRNLGEKSRFGAVIPAVGL